MIPVHYEGWKHFREGRAAAERAFSEGEGPPPRWLEPGQPTTVTV